MVYLSEAARLSYEEEKTCKGEKTEVRRENSADFCLGINEVASMFIVGYHFTYTHIPLLLM